MFGKDAEILRHSDDDRRVSCRCARLLPRASRRCALPHRALAFVIIATAFVILPVAFAEITPPLTSPNAPISIQAGQGSRWYEGEYEVWSLEGDCTIVQGNVTGKSRSAVVWINRAERSSDELHKVRVPRRLVDGALPHFRAS
jgi:hypothetical protein